MEFLFYICCVKNKFKMETKFLLPNKFKRIGWILLFSNLVLWVYVLLKGEIDFFQTSVFAVVGSEFVKDTKYFTFINTNIR